MNRAACSSRSTARRAQASELQIEFERLQVDKRAQATPLRVESSRVTSSRSSTTRRPRTHYVALSESGQVLSSSPAKVQEVAP